MAESIKEANVKIHVKGLAKHFGRTEVLRDISTDIHEGEVVCIIGPSGGGKSTFLRCLNKLEAPSAGTVIVDGADICDRHTDINKVREKIGMVFQHFNLFNNYSVLDNLTLAPMNVKKESKAQAREKARKMLDIVGLGEKADAYPDQLSGGQKQRVAIARALATKPKYLLCDEATSALDPNTTRQILDLLKEINEKLGVTIVVITHEMRVIDRICDSVAVIDSSHIAEVGKVSAVFSNPQSQIARDLIVPKDSTVISTAGGRRIRLIFDGKDKTNDPLISRMVLECGAPVNILFADTRIFEGVLHGHMVIELPNDKREADKIITWLSSSSVNWKEEI